MNKGFGYLESPKDYRDYRMVFQAVSLPEEYELPKATIKDQGVVGSCVAHSLSEMLEKYGDVFSTGWIYGYRPTGYFQGSGMYPREALKTIKTLGAVKQSDFPYNIEMVAAKNKVDENIDTLKSLASSYTISAYARLYNEQEIKQWLLKGVPVPFAIKLNNLELDEDNVIEVETTGMSGHAMLIYGWNKTGWKIQNSWR